MWKLIYLVNLLSGIDKLSFICAWLAIPITFLMAIAYVINNDLEDDDKVKSGLSKIISKGLIFLIVSICITIAIPNKEAMYMMFLTKDYTKEELYQMSKYELKDNIDYVFEKLEDLGDLEK